MGFWRPEQKQIAGIACYSGAGLPTRHFRYQEKCRERGRGFEEFLGVGISQGEPVTGRIQIPRIEMESDVEIITRRHVPSQIGIFTQIRIGFKDAARERPVLVIDEGKLQ